MWAVGLRLTWVPLQMHPQVLYRLKDSVQQRRL